MPANPTRVERLRRERAIKEGWDTVQEDIEFGGTVLLVVCAVAFSGAYVLGGDTSVAGNASALLAVVGAVTLGLREACEAIILRVLFRRLTRDIRRVHADLHAAEPDLWPFAPVVEKEQVAAESAA